jgi:hypothetical protein
MVRAQQYGVAPTGRPGLTRCHRFLQTAAQPAREEPRVLCCFGSCLLAARSQPASPGGSMLMLLYCSPGATTQSLVWLALARFDCGNTKGLIIICSALHIRRTLLAGADDSSHTRRHMQTSFAFIGTKGYKMTAELLNAANYRLGCLFERLGLCQALQFPKARR